jgi:hypothetical protein
LPDGAVSQRVAAEDHTNITSVIYTGIVKELEIGEAGVVIVAVGLNADL